MIRFLGPWIPAGRSWPECPPSKKSILPRGNDPHTSVVGYPFFLRSRFQMKKTAPPHGGETSCECHLLNGGICALAVHSIGNTQFISFSEKKGNRTISPLKRKSIRPPYPPPQPPPCGHRRHCHGHPAGSAADPRPLQGHRATRPHRQPRSFCPRPAFCPHDDPPQSPHAPPHHPNLPPRPSHHPAFPPRCAQRSVLGLPRRKFAVWFRSPPPKLKIGCAPLDPRH